MRYRVFLWMTAAALAGGTLVLFGCQSTDRAESPTASLGDNLATTQVTNSRVLLEDDPVTSAVLTAHLAQPEVEAARTMLEQEGCAYLEHNSLILIQDTYEYATAQATPQNLGPDLRRVPNDAGRLTRSDTIVWFAFENPTHDSAIHTAVVHGTRDGSSQTLLIELSIPADSFGVIREGRFKDGKYQPGNVGTEGWLACMGAGLAGSVFRCAVTDGGFGHCMGISGGATLVTCSAAWFFGAFD